jgi:hypothetical protein
MTFTAGAAAGALAMRLFSAEPSPAMANRAGAPPSATGAPQAANPEPPVASLPTAASAGTASAAPPVEAPVSTGAGASSAVPDRAVPDRNTPSPAGAVRADPQPPPGAVPERRPAAPVAAARTASTRAAVARPAGFRGSIAVQSAPPGAAVFVNGQSVGSTPMVLRDVPIGSRAVRIEAAGYQRWTTAVRVIANQQTRVTAQLQPAP